ncbi:bifunctional [glutamine synthetase] adenylyltransferase/[glutamine synthetase]-adenylyl-L-tyrosine phosphorylase [Aquipuribacter nitratireducens]|uniref:Bifunctional [glutamine synthetase] adenylyltransferase/[glutamine synthetase]-adenylyl-L-tyrosine phosphorylase n=1 Tax=Aquipuribacter nitratireducens TaxID=650104 RepID=A0ABW0GJ54_9MICO
MSTSGGDRAASLRAQVARHGFTDVDRALARLSELARSDEGALGLAELLADTADPDLALLGLVRLAEVADGELVGRLRDVAVDDREAPRHDAGDLPASAAAGSAGPLRRLVRVLGASRALADHVVRHPASWRLVADDALAVGAEERRDRLLAAVDGRTGDDARDALKVAYRDQLLAVAAADLCAQDATAVLPRVGECLADLADAALAAAHDLAGREVARADQVRLAVVALGKTGARELNYISDVDVLYVCEPHPDGDLDDSRAQAVGSRLAAAIGQICGGVTSAGSLWQVDAALRPEGKAGPLTRSVASHVAYYSRWAEPWEFQAMLKARVAAGDAELGERWREQIWPLVWQVTEREGFVEASRAMRRRVVEHIPAKEADRQLKLGRGGLRDVEFSVQLLQLVHGRTDSRVRAPSTLVALEALTAHGYVGRDDGAELDRAYRFLRVLEHRLQLQRLARTHVLPDRPEGWRRLARLVLRPGADADDLRERWAEVNRAVTRLHEKLFYRPLLTALASLSTDEVRLTSAAASSRLQALGYRDPAGALRHMEALTGGVSRRAAIQRTLLPAMLGMFADGADPDAGLLAFRRISDELGTTHWYLKMLRDSAGAAQRFAQVLASGRLVAQLMERSPGTTALLDTDERLRPPAPESLRAEVLAVAGRTAGAEEAVTAVRAVHRRELVRTGVADIVGLLDGDGVGRALAASAATAVEAAVLVAARDRAARDGAVPDELEDVLDRLPTRLLVVGLGRLAGQEASYASDVDVVVVHEPRDGVGVEAASEAAKDVVTRARQLLRAPSGEPAIELDAGLRPEGRQGELVRTLDAMRSYYGRWSVPSEHQALLRAVPLVGDAGLADRFREVIDPLRWPAGGPSAEAVQEIRRIKARVESERLPRGVDARRHVKLGRGGLTDVEWTVQLLQLRHAHDVEDLRTASTLEALHAARDAGLVGDSDAETLESAWRMGSRLRDALTLWRGRPTDVLPTDRRDLDGTARLMGYDAGRASHLEDDWLRIARHARSVVERVFFGWT